LLVRWPAGEVDFDMSRHRFELIGGHPTLDFLNTIHDWTVEPRQDYLVTLRDAARFGEAVGMLRRGESRRMIAADDGRELGRLVGLRTVLERVLRAVLAGGKPALADLAALDEESRAVASATRWRTVSGRLRREIRLVDAGVSTLRLRMAERALALLESSSVPDVKSCPACGWFFLDTSKNGSRRWCSMATCGASAKAKRYYQRRKAAQ
jgi:predicted RNA-binding Zn ribbon-like protein